MRPGHYRLLDHTADLGIEIFGADLPGLFTNAGMALFDLLVQGPRTGRRRNHDLYIQGQDLADLMVNWLRELLFLWNGYQRLVIGISVGVLSPSVLDAAVDTVGYRPGRHEVLREIKAVTYHRIAVEEKGAGWQAAVFFDL